jgi:hypothetical protein
MFRRDIGKEYVDFVGQNGYGPDVAKQLVHNGVDAAWRDEAEKVALHRLFDDEIATLDKELSLTSTRSAPPAGYSVQPEGIVRLRRA